MTIMKNAAPLKKLRAHMKEKNIDALVVTNTPDLRWLTGAKNTFDNEQCHVAFITQDEAIVHTDSRYFEALKQNLAYKDLFALDGKPCLNPLWVAQKIEGLVPGAFVALQDSASISFLDTVEKNLSNKGQLLHLGEDITNLRSVKTADEIASLQAAQEITDKALLYIKNYIQSGMTEKNIRAALDNFMLESGADALSFDSIVAGGPNGANPHARPGEYVIKEGDLVVIDFGAIKDDYHADMTRTFVVGEPSHEQESVYATVKEAHEEAAAALKPGAIGREIHEMAEQIIADAGYGDFFGHGLGHGVGIEIHENPNLNPRWDGPIPEGAVVTIEPGIYLPGKFGIRLEDAGVVTTEGFKPFTQIDHELILVDS